MIMIGKRPNFLLAVMMATFSLCPVVTLAITVATERKGGLFVSEARPEKVEGEYHTPSGCIQFSSKVQDDGHGGDRFIMVTTMEGEPVVVMRKPERASMMTVKMGQTKFLIQMNQPGSGLPRYTDYVVPQVFHNLVDSALSQNFIFRTLLQQLDSQNANKTRRGAIEELAMRSEANSIIEAAKALGNAGVMGTDNPAAQQFYVLAMRLAKIKEMMQRGAVANNDGTLPIRHSFHHVRMHSMYAYEQVDSSCPRCTTGSCPYMGDQSRECHGMCGYECSCWWWLCGDCCVHQGCLEHDNCCVKHGFWSFACLAPVDFSCSGYSC